MRFVIRSISGVFPDRPLGPRGSELACCMPAGIQCRQLNYGQWEGQVDVNGREWGFYWSGPDQFSVVLHCGKMEAAEALAFVRDVAEVVSQGVVTSLIEVHGDESQV